MNKINYFISSVVVFVTLTGCTTGNGAPSPQSGHDWNASLSVSGGFAGVHRHLSVDSAGRLIARDDNQDREVQGTLQSEQLARLDELLAALGSVPTQRSSPAFPSRCADCIESRLSATFNGKTYTAAIRSSDRPPQPYTDLIAYLADLLKQALSRQ